VRKRWRTVVSTAGNVTGRRFGFLAASSIMATSVIVAAALTAGSADGALAALLSSLGAPGSSTGGDATLASSGGGPPSFTPAKAGSSAQQVTRTVVTPAPAPPRAPAPAQTTPAPTTTPTTPTTTTTPTPPAPHAGRVKHVFVIALASPGYDQTFGENSQMPYLNGTVVPEGELLPNYTLLTDNPLPNYIAMVSGQPPNKLTEDDCPKYKEFPSNPKIDKYGRVEGDGCVYPAETVTAGDQLGSGGFTWRAYMEDMADDTGPHNCVHPDSGAGYDPATGGYDPRLNPFVYFHSLLDLGSCALNDVPLTGLQTDLEEKSTTPNYSFISPNLCHVGVSGQCPGNDPDGAAAADDWLSQVVPEIMNSAAYKSDGAIVITFGQLDSGTKAKSSSADARKVGAVVLSPFITGGETDSNDYTPYSIMRTTDELFGIYPVANASSVSTYSFSGPLLGTGS
jgi:phosphatidylinositol-3-phosphatase